MSLETPEVSSGPVSRSYRVKRLPDLTLLQFYGQLPEKVPDEFFVVVKSILENPTHLFIEGYFLRHLPPHWLVVWQFLQQQLAECFPSSYQTKFIHIIPSIVEIFPQELKLQVLKNIDEAIEMVVGKELMQPPKVGPLRAFYLSILKEMFFLSQNLIQRKKMFFKAKDKSRTVGHFSFLAKMNLLQTNFHSALSFSPEFLQKIPMQEGEAGKNFYNRILIKVCELLHELTSDRSFEITHLVDAKYPIKDLENGTQLVIPFENALGEFYLELIFPPQYAMKDLEVFFQS